MTRKQPSNGRDRRPKTVSISLGDCGQTTQDFAVGIGVFILAVAFVFSFMPSILTPFDSTVSSGQTAQADRIADRIVDDTATDSSNPNELDWQKLENLSEEDDEFLAAEFGLRTSNSGSLIDRVNVSVQNLSGDPVDAMDDNTIGRNYDGQSAASSARIVTIIDGGDPIEGCDPACRIVVRVW